MTGAKPVGDHSMPVPPAAWLGGLGLLPSVPLTVVVVACAAAASLA